MNKRQRNDKLMKAVGLRLRELRILRGLSQEKVLFINNIYLSNIENGHRDITIGTLVELCYTYNISLRDFFDKLQYDKS